MIGITAILGVWFASMLVAFALLDWPIIAADWARLREWREHLWDEEDSIIAQDRAECLASMSQQEALTLKRFMERVQPQEAAHPLLDPLGYDLTKQYEADLAEPHNAEWKHVPDELKTTCFTGDEMAHD